jgi:hypothetical protein
MSASSAVIRIIAILIVAAIASKVGGRARQ